MNKQEASSYKARKEAFVSDLSGSSLADINLVTLVAPAAILLWTALQKRQSLFTPYDVVALGVDFLLNVCAILFAFTLYSSAPVLLNILLGVPAIFLLLPLLPSSTKDGVRKQKQTPVTVKESNYAPAGPIPNRPFLTNYRGAMMIATCVGILAVDFPVFPRRFAKVETWGTSMMDLGVGSFVFSAGVVSARALLGSTASKARPSLPQRLLGSLRHSTPLFILGLIRLYSVKGLDYAEHVTEYGVHWNFFFTLGLLPPFVELSDFLTQYIFKSYDILAIVVAVAYEVVLNSTSLLSYILISPRGPSLLSKNREGVFSFIGYLAVFLCGRSTGTHILPLQKNLSKTTKVFDAASFVRQERLQVLKNLAVQSAIYTVLFVFCISYYTGNLRVSRRLANAPYVFWIAAFNNAQVLLFGLVEHLGPRFVYWRTQENSSKNQPQTVPDSSNPEIAASRVMQAFNKNGLFIFLIANLLTGLVNMTVNTLDMSNAAAMGILIGYIAIVTGVALVLDISGVRIKL